MDGDHVYRHVGLTRCISIRRPLVRSRWPVQRFEVIVDLLLLTVELVFVSFHLLQRRLTFLYRYGCILDLNRVEDFVFWWSLNRLHHLTFLRRQITLYQDLCFFFLHLLTTVAARTMQGIPAVTAPNSAFRHRPRRPTEARQTISATIVRIEDR